MGLLDLFKKRRAQTGSSGRAIVRWTVTTSRSTIIDGPDRLEVVGESFYQDHLWTVVGGYTGGYVRIDMGAVLVVEHGNPHDDANAISVWIDAGMVGHLAWEAAATHRAGLMRLEAEHGTRITLPGVVVGGVEHGRKGILGVFLDYSRAAFGLPQSEASQRHRPRTTPAQRTAHAKSLGLVSRYEYLNSEDEARALRPDQMV